MADDLKVGGIDLGSRSWASNGSAVLSFRRHPTPTWVTCRPNAVVWPNEALSAGAMADAIDHWALESGLHAVSIDGPQGWRDPHAAPRRGVGRRCEYEARTPGKTGAYGRGYPSTYLGWIRFSIGVFEHLHQRAHVRGVNDPDVVSLVPLPRGRYYLLECFPTSTWRSSGLAALPGHASAPPDVVLRHARTLWSQYGLPDWESLNHHDHLQAVVAALTAAALLGGPGVAIPRGEAARKLAAASQPSHVVEGLIWDARPLGGELRNPPVPEGSPEPEAGLQPDAMDVYEVACDYNNPLLPDDRDTASEAVLQRGVGLFRELARRANAGEAIGIGYGQFACLLHEIGSFQQLTGRQFLPSDSGFVVRLAHDVTRAAGGRIAVTRGNTTIPTGMDTFIWNASFPFDRPQKAWLSRWGALPYTSQQWRQVFPDGLRRLYQ